MSPEILVFDAISAYEDIQYWPNTLYPNAGLGAVSGILQDEGYHFDQKSLNAEHVYQNRYKWKNSGVDISDFSEERVMNFLDGEEDKEIKRKANQLADKLDIDKYDIIMVSIISDRELLTALPVLKERAHDKLTIIGGPFTQTNDLEVVKLPFIDYGVLGDAEIPLPKILEHEIEGKEIDNDTGIVYECDGELIRGDYYRHPMEMKPKPYFAEEIMDLLGKTSVFDKKIVTYKFGRGCTQNCSFCNYFTNRKHQYKSIEKVISDIKEIKKETGADAIHFTDSNIFNDPDYVKKFAERLIEEEIDIKWSSMGIILSRDQEYFDKLSESGCEVIFHGIESASNSVLHRMRKAESKQMIRECLKNESRAGIKTFAYFIVDFVDETWDEYEETIDFLKQNPHLCSGEGGSLMINSGNMPLYTENESFGVEITERHENSVLHGTDVNNVSWEDSRGAVDDRSRIREIKTDYLMKTLTVHCYLRNFALKNPATALKNVITGLYRNKYADKSWLYI